MNQIYASLNAAQLHAVEATEGPVMVVAGPGTGKTQILSARIAKIIEEGRAEPNEILCLTYTEAGTVAMRKRLLQMIGTVAYKIHIHTFHSFCNKIIQENLSQFGTMNLDLISEIEMANVLRAIIDEFEIDNPLRKSGAGSYYEKENLKQFFQEIKRERIDVKAFIKSCEQEKELSKELPEYLYKVNTRTAKKGDLNREYYKMAEQLEKTISAAKAYPVFLAKLDAMNRYTYDDMILWVIDLFERNNDMLLYYQEQFQYILVDEYQDTNGAQSKILSLLTSHWEKDANLFVVGDDDQSIYRFQGASITNIFSFYEYYLSHLSPEEQRERVVVLTDNYRSSQPILDASMALIERNTERLTNAISGIKIVKNLAAKGASKDIEQRVFTEQYESPYHQTIGVAEHIDKLLKDGVQKNQIAVLYRNHAQSEDLQRYLINKNIPIQTQKNEDVFESLFIDHILNILKYIGLERDQSASQEDKFFMLLHAPFFNIKPIQIARLAYAFKEARREKRDLPLRVFLYKNEDETIAESVQLANLLEHWMEEKEKCSVQQIIEKIFTEGGVIQWVIQQANKIYYLQELNTFFDFVKEETKKRKLMSLSSLIETIELMKAEDIQLSFIKVQFNQDAIVFSTVHGSKGLEYDYVFVIGNEKNKWQPKDKRKGYRIPSHWIKQVTDDVDYQEERRLLYVAMTRARKGLILTSSARDHKGKDIEESQFISEITIKKAIESAVPVLEEDKVNQYIAAVLEELKKENPAVLEQEYIDRLLDNYKLSVTHLDTYLKCPLVFYFNNLLRIPRAKNDSFAFGNAIHFSLEHIFKEMKKNDGVFPPVQFVTKTFEYFLNLFKESFTETQFKKRLEDGNTILPAFYNHYVNAWNTNVELEVSFSTVYEDVPITGKMDKIEINGTSATVVDYKTGKIANVKKYHSDSRPLTAEELREVAEPQYHQEHGGDYWRQAVFYKILIDNEPKKNWSVSRVVFDFVEADKDSKKYNQVAIAVSPEDIQIVSKQIKDTYSSILAKKFDGCGKKDCEWCTFMNHAKMSTKAW